MKIKFSFYSDHYQCVYEFLELSDEAYYNKFRRFMNLKNLEELVSRVFLWPHASIMPQSKQRLKIK